MASNETRLPVARVNLQPRPGTPSNPGVPKLKRTNEYGDLRPFLDNEEGTTDIFHSTANLNNATSTENPQEVPTEKSSHHPPRRIKRQDTPRPSSRDSRKALNASEHEPTIYQDSLFRLKRQDTPHPLAIRKDETPLKNPEQQGLFRVPAKRRSSQDSHTEASLSEAPPKPSRSKRIRNALRNLFRRN